TPASRGQGRADSADHCRPDESGDGQAALEQYQNGGAHEHEPASARSAARSESEQPIGDACDAAARSKRRGAKAASWARMTSRTYVCLSSSSLIARRASATNRLRALAAGSKLCWSHQARNLSGSIA